MTNTLQITSRLIDQAYQPKTKKEPSMYYQVVFDFDDDDSDPRYSIPSEAGEDAPQDNTVILIDPTFAERHETVLDNRGFPTSASLEAWHRQHNPQLFTNP